MKKRELVYYVLATVIALLGVLANKSHGQTTQPSRFDPSPDSRIIYMAANGDDHNPGTVALPILTQRGAWGQKGTTGFTGNKLRPGFPDHLRLRCGDTFSYDQINYVSFGGRSAAEPLVIESYGTGPLPVIRGSLDVGAGNLALADLSFIAPGKDPDLLDFDPHYDEKWGATNGIFCNSPSANLYLDNVHVRYYAQNLALQGWDSIKRVNVVLRNVVSTDAYSTSGAHAQDLYCQNLDGLLVTNCLFDHGGRIDDPRIAAASPALWVVPVVNATTQPTTRMLTGHSGADIFSHDAYLQTGNRNVTVRNTIFARASSHGLQQRPGGVMENNLFLDNPLAGFVGSSGSIVRRNVVLGGRAIGPGQPRGMGLDASYCPAVTFADNIAAHKTDAANRGTAFSISPELKGVGVAPTDALVTGNIVYDWTGIAFQVSPAAHLLSVRNNAVAKVGVLYDFKTFDLTTVANFTGNVYGVLPAAPVAIAGRPVTLATWVGLSRDDAQVNASLLYIDPNRTIETYAHDVLNLADPTEDGFLTARRLDTTNDPRLTAPAVNDYVRAGFRSPGVWADHRPIGMLMLNACHDGDYAAFAKQSVDRLKSINAQGVIVWDAEGYPPGLAYVGDPRLIDLKYDVVFQTFAAAGLRTGLTIRPEQVFDGNQQPQPDQWSVLDRKVVYAETRWGCTLYYVDSNPWQAGSDGWRTLHQNHPGDVFFPENELDGDYVNAIPYDTTFDIPAAALALNPAACKLVDGAKATWTDADVLKLNGLVRDGHAILLMPAWWPAPNLAAVSRIMPATRPGN